MSAFVVDESTLNRAVNAIEHVRGQSIRHKDFAELPTYDCESLDATGKRLMEMNVEAVSQRYPSKSSDLPGWYPNGKLWTGEGYHYRLIPHGVGKLPYLCDILKGAQCLSYQCAEGNVPDKWPEYKALESVIYDLMAEIIPTLPEYEAASWG